MYKIPDFAQVFVSLAPQTMKIDLMLAYKLKLFVIFILNCKLYFAMVWSLKFSEITGCL